MYDLACIGQGTCGTAYFDNTASKRGSCLPHLKLIYLIPKCMADHRDRLAPPRTSAHWYFGSLTQKQEETQDKVIWRSCFQSCSLKRSHFSRRHTILKMLTQPRVRFQTKLAEGLLWVPLLAATVEVVGWSHPVWWPSSGQNSAGHRSIA